MLILLGLKGVALNKGILKSSRIKSKTKYINFNFYSLGFQPQELKGVQNCDSGAPHPEAHYAAFAYLTCASRFAARQ